MVYHLFPRAVHIIGHHMDGIKIHGDFGDFISICNYTFRSGYSSSKLPAMLLECFTKLLAKKSETRFVGIRSIATMTIICRVLIIKIKTIKAIFLEKSDSMLNKSSNFVWTRKQF